HALRLARRLGQLRALRPGPPAAPLRRRRLRALRPHQRGHRRDPPPRRRRGGPPLMAEVIVSGMRPTGRLHIGHLHGALANWVRLQEAGARCHFFSADWHALTTSYHQTEVIRPSELEMFVDWIAAGVDPEKSTLFIQSQVK